MTAGRDDQVLAGQYVIGALSDEARLKADKRVESDADFAQAVEIWRSRFLELDDTAEAIVPRDSLWLRVERSISDLAPAPPVRAAGHLSRFWNSLAALRVAALSSSLAAAVLALVAVTSVQKARELAARKPVYVAVLVDDATRQAGAIVNAFAGGRVELIPLTDIAVPDGHTLQIWTLWDRSLGPRSVGIIDRARTTQLDLGQLPPTGDDQLFEITLEPEGGSPIGRPTGPILFKGTTSKAL